MAQTFNYKNITTAATTLVKSGDGTLHALVINTPVASATITIYDNTAASGAKIGTITLPATLLAQGPISALYDIDFTIGLTVVTTGTSDLTVSWQ